MVSIPAMLLAPLRTEFEVDLAEPRIWLVPSGGGKDEHRDRAGCGVAADRLPAGCRDSSAGLGGRVLAPRWPTKTCDHGEVMYVI